MFLILILLEFLKTNQLIRDRGIKGVITLSKLNLALKFYNFLLFLLSLLFKYFNNRLCFHDAKYIIINLLSSEENNLKLHSNF